MSKPGIALALLVTPLTAQELGVADLDPLGQLTGDFAVDVALDGTAVGSGFAAGLQWPQPVRYTGAGVALLPTLDGDVMGEANGIAENGVITGASTDVQQAGQLTFFFDRAVRWNADGSATDLEAAAVGGASLELFRGWDVNASGVVVGFGRDAAIPAGRGFIWDAGVISELPSLPGVSPNRMTQAYGINDAGVVVGFAEDDGGFSHAVRWQSGVLTDLHASGSVPGRTSLAWDVNEAGWVAGAADFVDDFIDWRVAAVWRPDGTVIELGTLGGTVAVTYSINDANEAVGNSVTGDGSNHAFLWRDGVMVDLNDLIDPGSGWTIVEARSIANDGRIVGLGVDAQGLQPVTLVPNPCNGFFEVYGSGCPGTGGLTPALAGFGCPAAGQDVLLAIGSGLAGAPGLLVIGGGQGILPINPTCDLQIAPVLANPIAIALDGAGALELLANLPPTLLPLDLYLQAFFVDLGAPNWLSATNPLRMSVQ